MTISEHLKHSLKFLDISSNKKITVDKPLPLGSMTKLTFLNFTFYEKDFLQQHLPCVSINKKIGHIASPNEMYNPQDGLWEIKINQIQLFQDRQLKNVYL